MLAKGGISLRLSEPRIKPIEESEWTDVERALLGPIKEERGSVPNIYRTFARHPELFTPRLNFGRHLQRESTLPARDREVLINRIAWLASGEYEWAAHNPIGRREGLTEDEIAGLSIGPTAEIWDPGDRALLQAVDEQPEVAFVPPAGRVLQRRRALLDHDVEQRREWLLADLRRRIRDVVQGPDGLIYVLTAGGFLGVDPARGDAALLRIEPVD